MGVNHQRLILIVFSVVTASRGLAADYNYSATLLTRVTQQHNLSMATKDAIDEQTLELNGGLQAIRSTEVHSTNLDLYIKDDRYKNYREYEQDLTSFSLAESYKQERNQFNAKVAISRSTTLGNSFETGELVRLNVPVIARSLNGGVTRLLSENLTASTSADWSETRYGNVLGVQSQDYDRDKFALSASYKDSEHSNWTLSSYQDSFAQIDGRNITTLGGAVSRYQAFGETWTATASLGRRKTQVEGKNITGERFAQDNYGRVMTLAIQRRLELGAMGLNASQDLSARADGIIEDSKRLEFFWRTAISPRLDVNFKSAVIDRTPILVAFYTDRRTTSNYNVSGNMRYLIAPSVSFDVSGRWTRRLIEEPGSTTQAEGSAISIGLHWKM